LRVAAPSGPGIRRSRSDTMAEEGEAEAPWSVEVPQKQVNFLLGPNGETLKRLCKATGCDIEVSRQKQKGNKTKSVSYGGQTQFYEDADGGGEDDEVKVKVFIRGVAKKRLVAAEVLTAVANGEDPEDLAARAEGALVLPHELQHPDREAWARWRLLTAAHALGATGHLGRRTLRLALTSGAALAGPAAGAARAAAEEVLQEAMGLVEIKVEALDALEPEEAASDLGVAPLVDQYGVMVQVCDQDDNALSEFITVRLFGPPDGARDAADLLAARFVHAKATASILQVPGEVQAMPSEHAADFAGDVEALEAEFQVTVHRGKTALWISGANADKVAETRKTLQEMLQFYLPAAFHLVEGLQAAAIQKLLEDQDLGVLMAREDCVVMVDELTRSVWICGKQRAAVLSRIEVAKAAAASAPQQTADEPTAKRRRTSALSHASVAL